MYNTMTYKLARGLGWFSIALGAAEVLAPGAINRSLGMKEHDPLVRGFGLREIVAGVGILTQKDPTPWVWSRVAGDALDIVSLMFALDSHNPRRGSAAAALTSVVVITALDVLCARSLNAQVTNRQLPRRDYSDRSGLGAKGASQARNVTHAAAGSVA